MTKIWNFSAGPSMLPPEVLQQAQAEILDWQGLGVSVMEISHRSPEFEALLAEAKQDLRDLLDLPEAFEILFTTGGAQAQFALLPMNLLEPEECADYLITGAWSLKAANEAKRFAKINVVANGENSQFKTIPAQASWQLNPKAKYFHYVTNETVHGIQMKQAPVLDTPLVADMSSDFLSKPIDFSPYDVVYAGAQKNIGAAGLTVVIIRRELLKHCTQRTPHIFNYANLAEFNSMPNTPPTYIWYLASLVFKWLKKQGGLSAVQQRNEHKAQLLYQAIDQSDLYINTIDPQYRSVMNVVFDFKKPELLTPFLTEAKAHGLIGLKGHKIRGGVRASIYNAMPEEGVQALVDFMKAFAEG